MLEVGLGALYLSTDAFWAMTWGEFAATLKGWKRLGPPAWLGGSEKSGRGGPLTQAEADDLLDTAREVEEILARATDADKTAKRFLKAERRARRG